MKKLSFTTIVISAILLSSCLKESSNITPQGQKSLAMVVPSQGAGSSNVLLLKDGRTANPVSGIANFSTFHTGDKLSISFTTGATRIGIIDIDVLHYASAQDSVFIPNPGIGDSTTLTGTFTGWAHKAYLADSSVMNRQPWDTVSLSFYAPNNYITSIWANGSFEQHPGTYTISNGTITFSDQLIAAGGPNSFSYHLSNGFLYMWATLESSDIPGGGVYYSYTLTQSGTTESVPPPSNSDSTSLKGVYKGQFTKTFGNDSVSYPAEIYFNNNSFKVTFDFSDHKIPSVNNGMGTFTLSNNLIDFTGWSLFTNTGNFGNTFKNHFVINYSLSGDQLLLWTTAGGEHFYFSLKKE